MKDEKVPKNLATQLDSAFIRKEPFGLVLIIAPWNYPLNLSLEPLVGALAAGNCVLLKPSEISKSTEKVLAEVLPRYLDQSCFAVVLGGPQETGQLLEHKFDYIFFTDPATSPGQGLPAATLTDKEGNCGSRGARVLCCSYRFPGGGSTRRRKPGGCLTTLHHHTPKLGGLWAPAPQDRGCRGKAGRPPEASFYARSPRQSVQRPMDRQKLLRHNLLTSPGLSFLIGSPRVGKIVMAAAAKHLTPVTLELGGKNPCYVDDNCDPQTVANRVAFFRYFNSGQTCVAPDYILCSPEMQARLLPALQSAITRFYGEDPQSSPDLGRIISEKNFQRLRGLLSCGRVAIGGQSDESDRYIAPTVLVDVQETEPVMQEEIFGPILPIMNVGSLDEAIDFINRREKPLALYTFSNSNQVVKRVLAQTSSGGFCGNDGFMHMTVASLPFGGVGASGMGSYHGKFSFDTFSHHRACLLRRPGLEKVYALRYPPHTPRNLSVLLMAMETRSCSCALL
ncbi:aldehyde dehydrogenase family 3 member B1 isoform X2 [Balaenoptera acutorostrata]|nr:aldehyde dehydrogenase family 3 member B1 isoform X2 [Balaenoptera acutorostrata]XP_057409915.1 aldehyde dehydrogenase family 3 member B1 isoform X2 [Balaenoptera acutorostrata]XP_057409917.1 aldehyde dehydrogenase family 3 member B1 isoform X2 [Balaenoptera acutorostrata]